MISGVTVRPLKVFSDERGATLHMLRANDPHFEKFGEVYFSTVFQGAVKAWHFHRSKTVNFAVPLGMVRLVVFAGEGPVEEIRLGRDAYQLVSIRPGHWYGFQGLTPGESLVANCADEPFDPGEADRLPPDTDRIPFTWPSVVV